MLGPLMMRCALGRSGMTFRKQEGDGATPIGRWPVRRVLYRPDRQQGMRGGALRGARAICRDDGWCDAAGDRNYNRPVRHPYPASAERLWRDDQLYDVIVILGHNQVPRIKGGGSAIFMHLARETDIGGLAPTAGCVALQRRDLAVVLDHLGRGSCVRVIG